MRFTSEQIAKLVASLSSCTNKGRQRLLPRILVEWDQTDLEEHLNRTTRKVHLADCDNLERVAQRARELAESLKATRPNPRFALATLLLGLKRRRYFSRAQRDRIRGTVARLEKGAAELDRLASVAEELARRSRRPGPHRIDTIIRYLVMLDLAAIFEWATGIAATRRIRAGAREDAGSDYGPFWDFVSTAWPIIFGSSRGLRNAVRIWDDWRRAHDDQSALMEQFGDFAIQIRMKMMTHPGENFVVHEEDIEGLEENRLDADEVASPDFAGMLRKEVPPPGRWVPTMRPTHVLGNGSRRDFKPQPRQLGLDPPLTPQGVL